CLVAAVFGCVAENVIQNTSTNYERIFYATLVILTNEKNFAIIALSPSHSVESVSKKGEQT
ncbi:hypothetical protein, partial [Brevibacillus agri]|uniref:hypothetical protein n=1 Tax=Brevibacillus agri TaxID=51101 RepID=UPI002E1B1A9D|nr:hypothetical protein [Brevibacillus agri]